MDEPLGQILQILDYSGGDADAFVKELRTRHVPHLSFSSLTTVEACPFRYYLEYIKGVALDPPPQYFIKGKLFHQLASQYYHSLGGNSILDGEDLCAMVDQMALPGEQARVHLENAARMLVDSSWKNWEVMGVEAPFVMLLAPDLPPCVGVIDLILRQGDCYAVVDHKTGNTFTHPDPLQMVIYREYIRRSFGPSECQLYYDHYRWVNHPARLRKPAFYREEVVSTQYEWDWVISRFQAGYQTIRRLNDGGYASRSGACFMCPYRSICYH